MTETRHSIRFAPGNHLTVVVADLYVAEPSEAEFVSDAERYSDAVEEFNWDNPLNPHDQRFQLCSVVLLGPDSSRELQDSGVVMKSTTGGCPSCVSTGRIPGL